ncbi:MAG: translocation/assembly module TamB domain-containing protein, partial [Ferruginibacter sp.]
MSKSTYILKKTWRVFLFILLGIFSILLLAMVFINLPMGKTVVKNRVQSYLRDKLHTQVSIGSIDYSLPEWLEIKNVYIEDQHHDTLAYGEEISVDLNMVKLAFGKTDIQKIYLKNILLNINRKETDTAFNYLFVMDAFTGNKSSTAIPDTAALKLTLDRLVFDDVALRFQDQKTGNDFKARIDTLNVTLDVFQPDRVQFYINDFYARGINFNMKTYKDIIIDTLTKRVIDTTVVTPAYALFLKAANINLYDLNVDVSNTIDGMQYANNIQHIKLTHSIINLQHSIATADSLTLDSSFVKFVSPLIASKNPDTTAMVPWYLKLAHLDMKDNQVEFTDNTKPKAGGFDPFHMKLQQLSTNIDDFHYSADTLTAKIKDLHFKDENGFSIDSLHLSYLQTAAQLSATEIYLKTPQSLIQDQVIVNFDTVSATRSAREKNSTVSANINNSIIAFNDLYQLMPSMKSTLPPSKFANLSLRVNTELRGNLQHIYLPYLQLSGLTGSSLAAHGNLYNISDPERFSYDIYIEKSRITKTDLLKFMPAGNEAAMRKIPQVFSLTGRIQGDKNNITADINTSAPGASFSGIIALHNVSNPDKLDYDINLRSTDISRDFILAFMPAGSLPPQISLPDRINASGLIKGTSNSLTLNAKLKTSYGNATAKGYINNFKNPEAAVYDMDLNLASFNLGKLLGQSPTLGLATGKLVAKGKGFNYKTMVADISGNLAAFSYNGYTYTNVDVVSAFNRGIITSSGNVRDPNLRMAYNLTANVRGEYPALDAWSRVDTIRLLPLHLYTDTLDASFTANIHATDTRPRHLDLQANLDSTYLNTGSQQFYLDSMSLAGTNQDGVDDISFQAPFGFVHANGAFDYDKIGTSLSQYVNHYYHFNKAAPANVPDQQISFEAEIRKNPIVLYVVPGLQDYENISFNGSYSSAYGDSALNFKASAPYLVYQDMVVRNGKADINSRNEKLNYNVSLDTLVYMANKFYGSRVKGYAANDSLAINATTQDSQARDWFGANATLSINGEEYTARLNDNLLLNYETWKVAPDNYILYSPQGIIVNNFMMRSDTSSISIASRQLVRNSPIDINIDNFNLKSISSFTSSDTLLVQGILDAKLLVSNLDKKLPAVTGNAQVKDFAFMQQPVGDITANLVEQSADVVAGNIAVTGNGNDIYADGKYFLNNTNEQIAVNIDVRRLTMQTLQGFMGGFIRNSSGAVSGNVVLSGKVADPKWKGEINFDSSRFVLSEYGSALTINNQKIILDHPVIRFNNFIVQDSLNHPLRVDGTITAKSFSEFGLDLSLDTKNFIVVNNPNTLTNEIYGFASVDANMKITGNSTSPDIEGNVKLNDNSNLTIVIPEQNYNKDAAIPV